MCLKQVEGFDLMYIIMHCRIGEESLLEIVIGAIGSVYDARDPWRSR